MAELADEITPDQDTRLDQAEGVVRAYCGWHIAPKRAAETYQLQCQSHVIALPTLHLVSVESIDDGFGTMFVANRDYYATESGVLTRIFGFWPMGTIVTFTHGFDDAPPEVTGVVQAVAQRSISNPGTLVETQTGPYTSIYGPRSGVPTVLGLTDGEKATLDTYRLRLLP